MTNEKFEQTKGYFARIPKDKLREIARKGGEKSNEARQTRKAMVEYLDAILNKPALDETNARALKKMGLDADILSSSMLGLSKRAERGDTKAIELIAKLRGEYVEKTETTMTVEDYFKDHEIEP